MPFPATPVTLRQLRYLVALEETRHFRHAAEVSGISQPSLSVQIKALEDALSIQLVERGSGPVQMTAPGREVCRRAREILSAAQGLMDLSVTMKDGLGGTLRLGTSATIGPYLMPYVISELQAHHPDLRLYIREEKPKALLQGLSEGNHDLILTQLPAGGRDVQVARLFRDPLLVVMPKGHPLADMSSVTPQLLAQETILSLAPSYALYDLVAAFSLDVGATLARDYEGTSLDALRQMVAMGMGVTLLPSLYIASEIMGRANDVVVRPLEGRRIDRSVGLVWRSTSGDVAAYSQLAQSIRDTARGLGELTIEA